MESWTKSNYVFAYYVTGHGFGHATRVAEVAKHIIAAGHEVHVVTAAPEFVFKSSVSSAKLHVRKVLLDCGAVQSDALTVDRCNSLEKYRQTAVIPRAAILSTEVTWLQHVKADLVLSDIVPVACRAAAEAGIPSVCITNFSWDFIYADYVMAAGHQYRSILWQIAEDYSHAEFLLRLPGYCPMPAFRDTIDVPLVVRKPQRSKAQVRKELGMGDKEKLLLFNFGGQDASWALQEEFLPEGWKCLVCAAPAGQAFPSNFKAIASDAYTPDLIAASDCMLGKIGYGTTSEALAFKVPFVFVRRDYFNEEPFLRNMLECHQCGVEMIRRDFLTGCWSPYLEKALKIVPSYKEPLNGGEVIAKIVEDMASGKYTNFHKKNGARRLQDAIVFGFQLQRIPGQELGIANWYMDAEKELNLRSPSSHEHLDLPSTESSVKPEVENFEILHGDGYKLPDTTMFLKSLSKLANMTNENVILEPPLLREWLAASGIFDWKDDIFVSRAPGRLDVMGGIGDYSGSLVLQMPIGEACHVAVQLSQPGKQPLWKHAKARKGSGLEPVIQIVSLGAELCNRSPTFDMDIADFLDGDGKPITYEEGRSYFARDSSQKWAAYVAGTILVLMREKGMQFQDGINILVSSAVPEGKGVSSSAAVEVATMSALIAAYGLNILPRETAVLCQKVENHVVGAPCGVMDQMASACGEAYRLLAMICQPAEVKEHVNIPTHIRFWGIDSGIRHSVGGTDYGSVRVGTFMGRTIITSTAKMQASLAAQVNVLENGSTTSDADLSSSFLQSEIQEEYLCNLSTSRYESVYAKVLPEKIKGEDFIITHGSHKDKVTSIDMSKSYSVKAPTAHAVYENFRTKTFAVLLGAASSDEQLKTLGELMYQSHNSYSNCGLGSAGTDRLVQLVRQSQHSALQRCQNRLFGAKITGGGSGGTVCVMGWNCRQTANEILKIKEQYKESTGHLPFIFEGSSPGAGKFGYLRVRRK